jgi:hypothetical protein
MFSKVESEVSQVPVDMFTSRAPQVNVPRGVVLR